jgi:hypothetical protein
MVQSEPVGASPEERIFQARKYRREYMRLYRALPGKRERHNELSRQSKARKRAREPAEDS